MVKNMNIGDRLRKTREAKNMTAKKLSELSGVPEKTIYRIETGEVKDPKLSSIIPLLTTLKCSADELIFGRKEQGLSGILENYLKQALDLPAQDKADLIKIIEKFLIVEQFNYMERNRIPVEIREQWELEVEERDKRIIEKMVREEEEEERYENQNQ